MNTSEIQQLLAEHCQRVIAVINGKGGAMKTSVSVNVAAMLAHEGMRVLVIDMDVSGAVALRFGVQDSEDNDLGASTVQSVVRGSELRRVQVREGIDIVFGGEHLQSLHKAKELKGMLPTGEVHLEFAVRVSEVASDYDIVIIDTSLDPILQKVGIAPARWCLVPMKPDYDSIVGINRVAPIVGAIRKELNPDIDYLGAVIGGHNPQATTILASMMEDLASYSELIPMFDTTIRHSAKVAHVSSKQGQTVLELEYDAEALKRERLDALKNRRKGELSAKPAKLKLSAGTAVGGVVADYHNLTAEICARISAAEEE